jgi:predicted methyltransferase
MSESGGVPEDSLKPQVKPETWIKWSRSVYNALKVCRNLHALYEATDAERIPRKRVQSILSILQGLGLLEIRGEEISLLETGVGIEAAALKKDAMELKVKLEEAEAKIRSLEAQVGSLEEELRKQRAGLGAIDCAFLMPLGVVGASGQNLYYCSKRRLTMGEKAGVCLLCDLRVPRGSKA